MIILITVKKDIDKLLEYSKVFNIYEKLEL